MGRLLREAYSENVSRVKEISDSAPWEDIYLFGEITDERAALLVQQIELVRRGTGRLRLWICSLGGDLGGASLTAKILP